ncbi:unnamed protein product [Cunninghamella blakesleeana]
MITQYTYFKDKGGNGSARIYYGVWDKEDTNQPLQYRIKMSCRTGELYDETDIHKSRKEPLLVFRMENCSQDKGEMISEDGTVFSMKQHGVWSIKWTFLDGFNHHRPYTWKINGWETSWSLTDDLDGQTIAEFKRSNLSIKKQGVLTIYVQVAPYFLSCILLSHKILHQKLKEDEATRGS